MNKPCGIKSIKKSIRENYINECVTMISLYIDLRVLNGGQLYMKKLNDLQRTIIIGEILDALKILPENDRKRIIYNKKSVLMLCNFLIENKGYDWFRNMNEEYEVEDFSYILEYVINHIKSEIEKEG